MNAIATENRFLTDFRPTGRRKVSKPWAEPLSAANRTLVILMDNGGVDLGIPALVDKILKSVPGADIISDTYRQSFVKYLREKLLHLTDNLLESFELTLNRYAAAKPEFFADVLVLRDGTASYDDLKRTLIALAREQRIVDLFVLTHGSSDYISVKGGIDGSRIRAIKTEFGKPLTLRAVYMMNCVGSSLNQAWLDAGAKVSAGAIRNNYLPEPTTYFFWGNWKAGQTFENAVTGAYRKSIDVMNGAIHGFFAALPIPGSSSLASLVDVERLDFVKDSAPVIQGGRNVTISTDTFSISRSGASSLAMTVLPVSVLQTLSDDGASAERIAMPTPSATGLDLIKRFEGFRNRPVSNPAGNCTVGYGSLLHEGNCDGRASEQPYSAGIAEAEASALLSTAAGESQRVVADAVNVSLNQNQSDALVSFVCNVGADKFLKSTLLRVLNEGKHACAPPELRKWTKARQGGTLVELPELVERREAEVDLFARPVSATESLSAVDHAVSTSSAFADVSSSQSEQSTEVRRRVARSIGQAEAGGRFDLVHDDSNRVNFGIGSWTGTRIADVLDTYEQVATEAGSTASLHGNFGGQIAFDAFRQRFRTQGVAATATAAERAALRALGADVALQEAQIRHLANDVRIDLDSIRNRENPWYPFIDGGMGAITELAAHVLVHAKHQAGNLANVLSEAIAHFGGEAALGTAMVNGTVTERQFLTEVGEQIVRKVRQNLQAGVRNRYRALFNNHANSDLSYYFNPAN